MKEQKILIFNSESSGFIETEVNRVLSHGWLLTNVTAQHVSTGGSGHLYGNLVFIFEREKS